MEKNPVREHNFTLTLRKVKNHAFIPNSNRKNVVLIREQNTLTTSFQHWLPERKWKNPNLNKNLQLLQDPCSGPNQLVLQEGVASFYQWNQPPLVNPFYRQNSFSSSLGFHFTLWSACNILVWGSTWERGSKMQGEVLQMSGRAVPGQLGPKLCLWGEALVWLGRMWAQPHLVCFTALSKSPELLHSFSMSYILSDY